ncbi:MAG: lactonase family protein [Anaerolineaceae bacterium]|nr:lactonase family protein [Anaerolineaceae bacterium]
MKAANRKELLLLAGSYTRQMPNAVGRGEGIYSCWFDTESGTLRVARVLKGMADPTYLAVAAGRQRVYSIASRADDGDGNTAAVCALALDPSDGTLSLLNCEPVASLGACHVWTTGDHALVACYAGGSVAALPLRDDGSLLSTSSLVQHEGATRVDPSRQDGPRAHCIVPDPSGRFYLVADLGKDEIIIYRLEDGILVPHGQTMSAPGAGPRHLAFHPDGRHAFVVNELSCSVTVFRFDPDAGELTRLGSLSTLPLNYMGFNTCAAIHVDPQGRFVYASNRGHDSIAVFEFDADSESLVQRSIHASGGRTPRDFTLTPDGNWLLAAHQDSANITSFRVDSDTGALEATGQELELPAVVCLKWAV